MFFKKATIYEHENPEEMNDTDGQEDRIDDESSEATPISYNGEASSKGHRNQDGFLRNLDKCV